MRVYLLLESQVTVVGEIRFFPCLLGLDPVADRIFGHSDDGQTAEQVVEEDFQEQTPRNR